MEAKMSKGLTIGCQWERTDEGEPAERASFGTFVVSVGQASFTEGFDYYVNRLREGPLVSSNHVGEWLAWNWWRLRWEPRTKRADWPLSHQMSTIGNGFVWPNITIQSDGERIVLIAKPSRRADAKPFRYVSDRVAVIGARQFEDSVDNFMFALMDRLADEGVADSNASRLWRDINDERKTPALALRRRLEALAAIDPDSDDKLVDSLVADSMEVGEESVSELAADEGATGVHHSVKDLQEQAHLSGYAADTQSSIRLANITTLPRIGEGPAWKRGSEAARLLRSQEKFGERPISNKLLEELSGVFDIITGDKRSDLSFSLMTSGERRVALKTKFDTGRRFHLARILGDQLAIPGTPKLKTATAASTYRQKMQRAFAAEFLCPFDSLLEFLDGEVSNEAREEAARHFQVSERTVWSLLANHGRLDTQDLDGDFESLVSGAAA
jgi:hypothetical protein